MGAASTDRLHKQRKASARKSRWPRKYRRHIVELREEVAETHRDAERQVRAALDREAEVVRENVGLQDQLKTIYENGPAVFEIVEMKQRWIGARLWWALRFAWSKKLRFERIVEGS